MAALSANAVIPPRHDPGSSKFEATYKAHAADEYFVGSITGATAGRASLLLADGEVTLGFCLQRTTITAQDQPVKVHIKGIWWVTCAQIADADLRLLAAPAAASDNMADLVVPGTGAIPGTLGMVVHVDVTGASGWLDLDTRALDVNTA